MHEANLDRPKNDSNTIPDTTYVSTSGYSKSGLYYKVTDSKIGDVVVIRVGLNGSNKATHSHAAILGNIELKRMKNGNVIAVRKTLQSSGGDQTINMGNEFPSGYLKKLHSQDWETKV